jgi:hypothetical protein
LSTRVLATMRNGLTYLQAVELLKFSSDYGITPYWNILYGFPEEEPNDYVESEDLARNLTHLQPPACVIRLRLDRFSPLFNEANERGLTDLAPGWPFRFAYPMAKENLEDAATWYDFSYSDGRDPETYVAGLKKVVEQWRECSGDLRAVHGTEPELTLIDTRERDQMLHKLNGFDRVVYDGCYETRSFRSLTALVGDTARLRAFLDRMERDRLMTREGDRYLSLALSSGVWI